MREKSPNEQGNVSVMDLEALQRIKRLACGALRLHSMRTSRPELYCRLAMSARTKAKSRIRESVRETARDLHDAGFIDKRRIRDYDVLGSTPVRKSSSATIRALRHRYKPSQAVLAPVLNTSLSAVRQWEIGDKHPSGPSLKLLILLDRKGLDALL